MVTGSDGISGVRHPSREYIDTMRLRAESIDSSDIAIPELRLEDSMLESARRSFATVASTTAGRDELARAIAGDLIPEQSLEIIELFLQDLRGIRSFESDLLLSSMNRFRLPQVVFAENLGLGDPMRGGRTGTVLPEGVDGAFVGDGTARGTIVLSFNLQGHDIYRTFLSLYGEAFAATLLSNGVRLAPGPVGERLAALALGTPAPDELAVSDQRRTELIRFEGVLIEANVTPPK